MPQMLLAIYAVGALMVGVLALFSKEARGLDGVVPRLMMALVCAALWLPLFLIILTIAAINAANASKGFANDK